MAPEIIFGWSAIDRVGDYVSAFAANHVLVVSDPGVQQAGWTDRVCAQLPQVGIRHSLFTNVSPNPRTAQIAEGARLFSERGCDMLVAVGGGSAIDCAKGIGVVASNGGPVGDYEGVDRVPIPMPPLLAVPTTAGSAAEVSQFAIVTDEKRRLKFAIISKGIVPDVALVDPSTTITMSAELTADTGMDALSHAVESAVSTAAGPQTLLYSTEAIRLIARYLGRSVRDAGDAEARSQMMLASMYAGLAFSNASLGLVHAMSHALGGYLDIPHGACNTTLLEHVSAFNAAAEPARYRRVLSALGEPVPQKDGDIVDAVLGGLARVRESTGFSGCVDPEETSMRAVDAHDLRGTLARNALADPCVATNPRRPTSAEVEELFANVVG